MPSLRLIQLNDLHGYLEPHAEVFEGGDGFAYAPDIGGLARIAGLAGRLRQERPALLLDGGDTLHGTRALVASQGAAAIPALNAMEIAAMTGHWEFAYGPTVLRRRIDELTHPFLAANVFDKSTGRAAFVPSTIAELSSLRIGVVGLASNIVDKTMPPRFSEGLRFDLDPPAVQCEVDRLRPHADVVVLLSHVGFPQDVELLGSIEGVDVCLSAHTHNRLRRPVRVGSSWLIQSGSHGSFLGVLDLEVSAGGVCLDSHKLITVNGDAPVDRRVQEAVESACAPHRAELDEVVGEATTPLDRMGALESSIDNLLLEAIRSSAGTELAFANGWRYGAPILTGPIRRGDLYNMAPMDPEVSTASLTGAEIQHMLEENLERTYSRDPFRQLGGYVKRSLGLRAYIKVENPPGERIQRLMVGNRGVDPSATYQVAYITEQAVPRQYGSDHASTGVRTIEALERYLARRPVAAQRLDTFELI